MVGGRVEVLVINGSFHAGIIVKDQRRARVLEKPVVHGRNLHHATVGGQVSFENYQRTGVVDGIVNGPDNVVVIDLSLGDVRTDGLAIDGLSVAVQVSLNTLQHRPQPAGVKEIFHQIGIAVWADVGDYWHFAANTVEVIQHDVKTGTPTHGHYVDNRVGRTSHGHSRGDGVREGGPRQEVAGLQVFPGHPDDAPTGLRRQANVAGIGCWNGSAARQNKAQGLGY